METLIDLMQSNLTLTRILWAASAVIGYLVFKRNRPSFYANRSTIWWVFLSVAYLAVGPAILLFSLFTFINPEGKVTQINSSQETFVEPIQEEEEVLENINEG